MFRLMVGVSLMCCATLGACGPDGGVASAGSKPVVAAVADATLPPPASVSPLAATTMDDAAVAAAWDALDLAATAADGYLLVKPSFKGTPAANRLADALQGAATWLTVASRAQRAGQAENYQVAISQASAAIAGAKAALQTMKGK